MKKVLLLIVSMLLLFSLCACSGPKEPYTVDIGWKTLEIDPVAKTITDRYNTYQYTYQYDISGDANKYTITITYPNGSTYFVTHEGRDSGNYRTQGHSDDYGAKRYMKGHILVQALVDELPPSPFIGLLFTGNPILGLGIILIGMLYVSKPRIAWWLEIGWLLKHAEPSNFALIVHQIIGALLILAGIIKFFIP